MQSLTVCPAADMYHAPTDTPALCRTSSLVEELGQIEYIFSDKTGTLTCNQMEFRQCSIGGIAYADVVEESKRGEVFSFSDLQDNLAAGHETARVIREFLTLLATCHTVIPEYKNEKITYQASSPDEAALVQGADVLGYTFVVSRGSPSRSGDQGASANNALTPAFRPGNRNPSLSASTASSASTRSCTSSSSTRRGNACRRSSGRLKARSSCTARVPIRSSLSAWRAKVRRLPRRLRTISR